MRHLAFTCGLGLLAIGIAVGCVPYTADAVTEPQPTQSPTETVAAKPAVAAAPTDASLCSFSADPTLTTTGASLDAYASQLPTTLRLSQVCHGCGGIEKKPLSLRVHECACGVGPVQRDVYSAWLACSAVADPDGSEWRLDANRAGTAWLGAESRLPAASSPISVQAFAAWAQQAASGGQQVVSLPAGAGGTERFAGAVCAMADEARNVVSVSHTSTRLDVARCRESERVGRVATGTPRLARVPRRARAGR